MYSEQLSDLNHTTPIVKPGLVSVQAIPKDSVTYIRGLPDILSQTNSEAYPLQDYTSGTPFYIPNNYIAFASGATWLNISKDFAVQMEMVETKKANVQLDTYQYKILFDLPNDDYATRGKLIQTFQRREWILIVKEITGASRLIGSLSRGADFSSQLATGDALKGAANKFTCAFTWETSPDPAFYIA